MENIPQLVLCFVCNEEMQDFSMLSKCVSHYSQTPYAQCISQVLGKDYVVVVSPDDKVCQQCSSLIDHRDKLKLDLNDVETSLSEKLKKKYQILFKNAISTPPSAEFQSLEMEVHSPCNEDGRFCESDSIHSVNDILPHVDKRAQKKKTEKTSNSSKNCLNGDSDNQDPTCNASTSNSSNQSIPVSSLSQFYYCKECRFSTINPSDINSHICDNKRYFNKFKVVISDDSSRKFKCNICGYRGLDTSSLKIHMKYAHRQSFYHCETCQMSYFSKEECCTHISFDSDNDAENNSDDIPLATRQKRLNKAPCKTVMIPLVETSYTKKTAKKCKNGSASKRNSRPISEIKSKKRKEKTSRKPRAKKSVTPIIEELYIKTEEPEDLFLGSVKNVPGDFSVKPPQDEEEDVDSFEDYHSKKIFECGFCSMRMDSREELQEHFKTHKSEKIICTHCKAKIPNFTAYRKHLMYHSKPSESVTCSECNELLNNIEALKFHMRLKHGCKLTCAHCEEQFAYVATLKSHIRRHIESQKYFCDSCNIYFPQMQSFRHHMQFVHRDPKCKICGKIISDTRKLRDHEKRHITEKEGLCPYCGKVLKTRNALKIHLMQHTGQYKYKCTICNRGITTRHAFNEHMNRHSSTPKLLYTCDKCGKQFNHAGTFSLHRKWHDNPYPYTCEYCGLKIRHTSLLRNHIRKEHTGEKPHECPHCHKRFLTKGQLRKHLPQHTGIFEFNCIDCNKGWVKKEYYNNHRHKVHGDPLPKRIIRNKADYKLVIPDDGPPPPIPIIEDSSDDNMNNMAHEIQQAIQYL